MKISRKTITFIYLPLVAMYPVLMGCYQVVHFLDWLLEWNIDFSWILAISPYSTFLLSAAFLISLYEHFCIYHRMVILSVLYCNLSCYAMDIFPSLMIYNISNIIAVLLIAIGIIGCIIHFYYQITDFIRYVRTKSLKNTN